MKPLTAFEKYLLDIPIEEAVNHVIFCLMEGSSGNHAWDLIARFNGKQWRCEPSQMKSYVLYTIIMLKGYAIGISEEETW